MVKLLKFSILSLLFFTGIVATVANAALISGDFRTESDLPGSWSVGPLVYQNLSASIDGGIELTGANFLENRSNWGGGLVHMDYDPTTNILTLDSQDDRSFTTFDAWINNIVFDGSEVITGIDMLSNGITNPTVNPILSFTANSIHIRYGQSRFGFTGEIAEFQITGPSSAVPEPNTLILFGVGCLSLAGYSRRRKE